MFSSISSWILSIAGIITLSILIELILPDGQINRYIKGVFSFVVVFVIISPVPKLLNKDFDYSQIFNYGEEIQVDENYIYQLNLDKINSLKEDIEEKISSQGYKNVVIYINADIFENNLSFKSISVDLSSLVISNNAEHIDISKIKKHIVSIIKNHIEIDEEVIFFD